MPDSYYRVRNGNRDKTRTIIRECFVSNSYNIKCIKCICYLWRDINMAFIVIMLFCDFDCVF